MIKKINFIDDKQENESSEPSKKGFTVLSSFPQIRKRSRKNNNNKTNNKNYLKYLYYTIGTLGVLFIVLTVLTYFLLISPARQMMVLARDLQASINQLEVSVENQDFDELRTAFSQANTDLNRFSDTYNKKFTVLKKLPFTEAYFSDMEKLLDVAGESLNLGELFVNILEPYAPELGFKSKGQEVENIDTRDRIVRLISLMPQFSNSVDEISTRVVTIDNSLQEIDAKKYPTQLPFFFKYLGLDPTINIREQILNVQAVSKEVSTQSPDFKLIFNSMPDFLGVDEPRQYLVIMANNNEIRASGGFNTAVGVVKLNKGIPEVISFLDTYSIDEGGARPGAQYLSSRAVTPDLSKYLYRAGQSRARLYARDATSTSGDFVLATDKLLDEFWRKDRTLEQDLDGVIQINNDFIENLLDVTGPVNTDAFSVLTDQGNYITVGVEEFNSENVTQELTNIAGGKLANQLGRKDIIAKLGEKILEGVYTLEPENISSMAAVSMNSLTKKDLILRSFDSQTQEAFEKLGYAGRLSNISPNHDYLHVNRSNYGAGKADWTKKDGFVTQEITKSVEEVNGKLMSTVNLTIKNPERPDWFKLNPCCFYTTYVKIFVPYNSKLINISSTQDADPLGGIQNDEVLQLTYMDSYVNIPEKSEVTLTYQYELPETINLNDYKLFFQRQPGTSIDPVNLTVDGKKLNFFANADRVITISELE